MNPTPSTLHSDPYTTSVRPRKDSRHSHLSPDFGGIAKNHLSPHARPRSASSLARIPDLIPGALTSNVPIHSVTSTSHDWTTPRHSPQPNPYIELAGREQHVWSVPTPPHSESGLPSVSADTSSASHTALSPRDYSVSLDPPPTSAAAMGSIGYMLPSQYGPLGLDDTSLNTNGYGFEASFRPSVQQQAPSHAFEYPQPDSAFTHAAARTSSPMLIPHQSSDAYNNSRAYSLGHVHASTPYNRTMSDSAASQHMTSSHANYASSFERSPSLYETSLYGPSQTTHGQISQSPSLTYPAVTSNGAPAEQSYARTMSNASDNAPVRVLNQKPKPQCWEHGCNGREFSTFSNLLRHQREKSGTAVKSYCPRCGAEFTRTTARNGHLAHEKCSKQRRSSEGT